MGESSVIRTLLNQKSKDKTGNGGKVPSRWAVELFQGVRESLEANRPPPFPGRWNPRRCSPESGIREMLAVGRSQPSSLFWELQWNTPRKAAPLWPLTLEHRRGSTILFWFQNGLYMKRLGATVVNHGKPAFFCCQLGIVALLLHLLAYKESKEWVNSHITSGRLCPKAAGYCMTHLSWEVVLVLTGPSVHFRILGEIVVVGWWGVEWVELLVVQEEVKMDSFGGVGVSWCREGGWASWWGEKAREKRGQVEETSQQRTFKGNRLKHTLVATYLLVL